MQIFLGQYDRTIDAKNRIQLPSPFRRAIESAHDGAGLCVTLGQDRGTLAIYTESGFEALARRIETEFIPGAESRRFELQFYTLASYVDMDKQGRLVLPERLRSKARLEEEVYVVGQKHHIEVWNRVALDRSIGIDWEGDDWPDWQTFLRMRPEKEPA